MNTIAVTASLITIGTISSGFQIDVTLTTLRKQFETLSSLKETSFTEQSEETTLPFTVSGNTIHTVILP